jgi:hypothetical protein
VAAFFGDYDPATGRSARLEQQMRTFVTLASERPSPDSFALEAYCAWALGDKVRARAALERASQLMQQNEEGSPNLDKLLMALQFAV